MELGYLMSVTLMAKGELFVRSPTKPVPVHTWSPETLHILAKF
jgi:hypothetical protein